MTLPDRDESFHWTSTAHGAALVCLPLSGISRHLFTTREWQLGNPSRSDPERAWTEVAASAGVQASALVRATQVHGRRVLVHRAGEPVPRARLAEADIIITADTAVAVAVQSADCVPMLLGDRRTGAVAAAHAGWRGLAARAPAEAVNALRKEFGVRPADLVVAIGPSIGSCCYEVGPDVLDEFRLAGFSRDQIARWFCDRPNPTSSNASMPGTPPTGRSGRWYFDTWTAARESLEAEGVPPADIYAAGLCTASHPSSFSSYRRDGQGTGRIAAVIRCGPLGP
jgi:YfiH family protein